MTYNENDAVKLIENLGKWLAEFRSTNEVSRKAHNDKIANKATYVSILKMLFMAERVGLVEKLQVKSGLLWRLKR